MVRSTGSQPRISVKVRGRKWDAADAGDWADREAFRRGDDAGIGPGQRRGNGEAAGRPSIPGPRSGRSEAS
jgi:hypothetical protein